VYHIADNEPLSTNEIVEMIAVDLGMKPKIWNIPRVLIKVGAKAGNILPLPLNEKRLQKLTENYVVSNNKITKAIGNPLPLRARDGMRKTITSFKN
jgi:nucleoside-diphosphate-sugar epimerase